VHETTSLVICQTVLRIDISAVFSQDGNAYNIALSVDAQDYAAAG